MAPRLGYAGHWIQVISSDCFKGETKDRPCRWTRFNIPEMTTFKSVSNTPVCKSGFCALTNASKPGRAT